MSKEALGRLLFAALLVGICRLVSGEPPPPSEERVARLIKDLGERSYTVRSRADRELLDIGGRAAPQLRRAARSEHPEVAARARRLLEQFASRGVWQTDPLDGEFGRVNGPGALRRLADVSGNRLAWDAGDAPDEWFQLSLSGRTFWEVADLIERRFRGELRPSHDWDARGFVFRPGGGDVAHAWQGPLRLRLVATRRSPQDAQSEGKSWDLELLWEDDFQLAGYRSHPQVVGNWRGWAHFPEPSEWRLAGPGKRRLLSRLTAARNLPPNESLGPLEIAWELFAVAGRSRIVWQDDDRTTRWMSDGAVAEFRRMGPRGESDCRVVLAFTFGRSLPEPRELLLAGIRASFLDAEGRPLTVRRRHLRWEADGGRLECVVDESAARAARIELSYPEIRSRRMVAFRFDAPPGDYQKRTE